MHKPREYSGRSKGGKNKSEGPFHHLLERDAFMHILPPCHLGPVSFVRGMTEEDAGR
jgi:hypothetical protein